MGQIQHTVAAQQLQYYWLSMRNALFLPFYTSTVYMNQHSSYGMLDTVTCMFGMITVSTEEVFHWEVPLSSLFHAQESEKVRITVIIALGKMLKQVNKFKPGPAVHYEIYCALVPLMLVMQENKPEVLKVSLLELRKLGKESSGTPARRIIPHVPVGRAWNTWHLPILASLILGILKTFDISFFTTLLWVC